MGNYLSLKTRTLFMVNPFRLAFCDANPNFVLKIEIDELRSSNLLIIRQKLTSLHAPLIDEKLDKIMDALKYMLANENPAIISQIDYYLFLNYNYPALQIKCLTAKENQNIHGTNSTINSTKYYCAMCNLEKI